MKLSLAIVCGWLLAAQLYAQSPVTGIWISEQKDARVELYITGNRLFGKLVWVQQAQAKDVNNPDANLRQRPVQGLVILQDFRQVSATEWADGTIYDPDNGKTYACKLSLQDGRLHIRGYIGISLLGRTTIWTRG